MIQPVQPRCPMSHASEKFAENGDLAARQHDPTSRPQLTPVRRDSPVKLLPQAHEPQRVKGVHNSCPLQLQRMICTTQLYGISCFRRADCFATMTPSCQQLLIGRIFVRYLVCQTCECGFTAGITYKAIEAVFAQLCYGQQLIIAHGMRRICCPGFLCRLQPRSASASGIPENNAELMWDPSIS